MSGDTDRAEYDPFGDRISVVQEPPGWSGDTDRAVEAGLRDGREVTPLDLLWIAMWDDLRHNATGAPTGLAIIARYRPQIEAAVLSGSPRSDTALDVDTWNAAIAAAMEAVGEIRPSSPGEAAVRSEALNRLLMARRLSSPTPEREL